MPISLLNNLVYITENKVNKESSIFNHLKHEQRNTYSLSNTKQWTPPLAAMQLAVRRSSLLKIN